MEQRKSCSSGKVQHESAGDARKQLAGKRKVKTGGPRRTPGQTVKVLPFRCPECGWWHVGHNTGSHGS